MSDTAVSLHALVVDPDDQAATSLAILLKRCGHQVYRAATGETALEKAPRLKPDVTFIDVTTPAANGSFIAHHFRQMPELAATLLVAVSSTTDVAARVQRSADFDDFLPKPYSMASVSETLARVHQKMSTSRSLVEKTREAAAETRRRNASSRQSLEEYWLQRQTTAPMPRVLFLGCDAEFLRNVSALLDGDCVTSLAFDSEERCLADLDQRPRRRKQCLVVDASSGAVDALAFLHNLLCRVVPMPVVALVAAGDVRQAVRLMHAGAFDVVERTAANEELVSAILGSLQDERTEAPARTSNGAAHGGEQLNDNDRRLLQLTVDGMVNKQIAREMAVSIRTVHIRRSALMKKLGARSRAELIRLAVESGLCD